MIKVKILDVNVDRPNLSVEYTVAIEIRGEVVSTESVSFPLDVLIPRPPRDPMNNAEILAMIRDSFSRWERVNRPGKRGPQAPFDQIIGQEVDI